MRVWRALFIVTKIAEVIGRRERATGFMQRRRHSVLAVVMAGALLSWSCAALAQARLQTSPPGRAAASAAAVHHDFVQVDGHRIFFREAGVPGRPVVLLLHGFPTSSHMFRDLIPKLATKYHVLAPDLPGFGLTQMRPDFRYGFAQLAQTIDAFTRAKGLERFALYVFDYGAPVGWRLAEAHPERITAIVTQNGNAYEEGLSPAWADTRAYWADPTPQRRDAMRQLLRPETTQWQYVEGVSDPTRVAPDGWLLDQHFLDLPGRDQIQLDLFLDYRTNVERYPQFQAYFRKHRPPLLAVWGARDPFFLPAGALAFKRDLPNAEIHLLPDTGHFALASHADEVAARMIDFLERRMKR